MVRSKKRGNADRKDKAMSKKVVLYGASDDNACIDGCFGADGVACYETHAVFQFATTKKCPECNCHGVDKGLLVTLEYAKTGMKGTWSIGVTLLDEYRPLPNWPMRWTTNKNNYSPQLEIELPDDAEMKVLYPTDEDDEDE